MGNLIIVMVRMLGALWRPRAPHGGNPLLLILAALMIVVIAPDLIAAIELTTLLDILGAALFWIAFIAGAQLLAIQTRHLLRLLLMPEGFDWLLLIPTVPARSVALMWMGRNAVMLLLPAILLREVLRVWI